VLQGESVIWIKDRKVILRQSVAAPAGKNREGDPKVIDFNAVSVSDLTAVGTSGLVVSAMVPSDHDPSETVSVFVYFTDSSPCGVRLNDVRGVAADNRRNSMIVLADHTLQEWTPDAQGTFKRRTIRRLSTLIPTSISPTGNYCLMTWLNLGGPVTYVVDLNTGTYNRLGRAGYEWVVGRCNTK